jgi:ubiquinone/menaquinone biosynthesis C-methylase UbiE
LNDNATKFTGTIPDVDEDNLGPLLLEFYAADLAGRVVAPDDGKVLETACGTGIATRSLREALPDTIEITETDLNDGMLDVARARRWDLPHVSFEQADALDLSFEDAHSTP